MTQNRATLQELAAEAEAMWQVVGESEAGREYRYSVRMPREASLNDVWTTANREHFEKFNELLLPKSLTWGKVIRVIPAKFVPAAMANVPDRLGEEL